MKVDIDKDELIAIISAIRPKETVTDKVRNLLNFRTFDDKADVNDQLEYVKGVVQILKDIGEIP